MNIELLGALQEGGGLGTQCMIIIAAMGAAISALAGWIVFLTKQKDAVQKAWNTFLQDQLQWAQSFKEEGGE